MEVIGEAEISQTNARVNHSPGTGEAEEAAVEATTETSTDSRNLKNKWQNLAADATKCCTTKATVGPRKQNASIVTRKVTLHLHAAHQKGNFRPKGHTQALSAAV